MQIIDIFNFTSIERNTNIYIFSYKSVKMNRNIYIFGYTSVNLNTNICIFTYTSDNLTTNIDMNVYKIKSTWKHFRAGFTLKSSGSYHFNFKFALPVTH